MFTFIGKSKSLNFRFYIIPDYVVFNENDHKNSPYLKNVRALVGNFLVVFTSISVTNPARFFLKVLLVFCSFQVFHTSSFCLQI